MNEKENNANLNLWGDVGSNLLKEAGSGSDPAEEEEEIIKKKTNEKWY